MSLLKSASKVSFLTMLSRVTGFVRDGVMAVIFGAQSEFDVFLLVFKIPNFMRSIFVEGAFSQAFIPVMTEYLQKGEQERSHFLSRVFSLLLFSVVSLTFLVWFFPSVVVKLFAYGLTRDPERFNMAVELVRYIFPYLGMVTISGFFAASLQTKKRFSLAAIVPALLNVVLITAAIIANYYTDNPIYGLAYAVPIAGALQVFLLARAYFKMYPSIGLRIDVLDPGIVKILALMLAAIYGVSVSQIGLVFDNIILSSLAPGSVSWIYYAERLSYLPLGVFGVAITTVLTPELARTCQSKNILHFSKQLEWGIISAAILGIPSAIGLYFLSDSIIATLFNHGRFTSFDVVQSSRSLQVLSIGIPAFMWVKVLASAFYARQDTVTPVKCATGALIVNMLVAVIASRFIQHVGISLAIVCSAYTNVVLLGMYLYSNKVYRVSSYVISETAKILVASSSIAVVYMCIPVSSLGIISKLVYLGSVVMISIVVYFICLRLFSIRFSRLNIA